MNIQEFLLEGNTVDDLCKKYKIKCKRHSKYKNCLLLKYKHNAKDNIYSREARGLILDEDDNYKIISYPYDRFYNNKEKYSNKINFKRSWTAYNKLDGRLMVMYFYKNEWFVSSSGLPDSSGKLGDSTLCEIFWTIFRKLGYEYPKNTNMCYMFEMVLKNHPIVVKYEDDDLILHGARSLITYKEYELSKVGQDTNFKTVEILATNNTIKKLKDLVKLVENMNHLFYEGVVVCDENFKRTKIKNSKYVKLSNKLGNLNDRNFYDDLCFLFKIFYNQSEKSEILSVLPEYQKLFDKLEIIIENIINFMYLRSEKRTPEYLHKIYSFLDFTSDLSEQIKNYLSKNINDDLQLSQYVLSSII